MDSEFPRPVDKKCPEGKHQIAEDKIRKVHKRELEDKEVRCSECGFSLKSLRTAFGEASYSVCDVCGKVGGDFEFYMAMDRRICEDCSGNY